MGTFSWSSDTIKSRVCFRGRAVELSEPLPRRGIVRTGATQRIKNIMSAIAQDPIVLQKTQDLCNTILNQPTMLAMRKQLDAFMGDDAARAQYETVMHKGRALHEKQHQSLPLSGEEISDFESSRDALLKNPVARGFIDAQEELHGLRDTIQDYVSKTIELGRLPKAEDFEQGGCCGGGGGGGCSDHGHDHGHEHSHGQGGGCCQH
jgi:cell fate (sporulation/competence/biofilm development) regulator YlbF (YheA/YmcA/DUF963 family)